MSRLMSFEFNPRNLQFTFQSEMAQKRQKLLILISVVLSLTIGTCAFTYNWHLKVVMLCLVEVLCSSLLSTDSIGFQCLVCQTEKEPNIRGLKVSFTQSPSHPARRSSPNIYEIMNI